jgi:hypothetical protein
MKKKREVAEEMSLSADLLSFSADLKGLFGEFN